MENKLGWGILATGWIAELFTTDLKMAGLHVSAVGSRSLDKAQAFASRFGIPSAHGTYKNLVADPQVDIVYIATPHPHHAAAALLAIKAGKHVLIEKPFTLNAKEAREVVSRAQDKNVIVLEAMWTRFLPHMKRIREVIASGALGDLKSLSAAHRQRLPDDPAHRLNALELGGGALLDLGIYPISFAIDILGPPTTTSAIARFKDTGVDAEVVTIMTHANGAISSNVSALDIGKSNTAHIFGSKARIDIDDVWYAPTTFRVIDTQGGLVEEFESHVVGRGMQYQAFEMEQLVATSGSSILMPPDESVTIMGVLDDIRRQIGLAYPGESRG